MKRLICVLFIAVFLCACNGGPKVRPLEATAVPDAAAVATAMPTATLLLISTPTPEPTATPTPVCTPTVEPTPTIEPTSTPEPPFTMAWASDTQIMVAYYQEMLPGFTSMCQWIADNAQEQNIVAYLHTGDMVDLCTNREQWALFSKGVELIAPKMPLFMTLGNHDFYNGAAWPVWSEQFFFQQIPEDHRYRDGRASYMEFSTGSTDFLFIQLAYRELNNLTAISWLKSVCDEHADRTVIFLVHGYLTKEGNLMNVAKIVEKELVAKCPNIRLVLSGHSRGISRQVFAYDDDGDGVPERTVNALMYDLQQDRERYGYFCLLTFDPVTRSLSVDSYSPFLDDHIYDDENPDAERFTLENVF